jgi:hypothetical protein
VRAVATMPPHDISQRPTLEDMRTLDDGDYYVWEQHVYVRGSLSGTQVRFHCLFCYTKYKNDGRPYARASRVVHLHGEYHQEGPGFVFGAAHCIGDLAHLDRCNKMQFAVSCGI